MNSGYGKIVVGGRKRVKFVRVVLARTTGVQDGFEVGVDVEDVGVGDAVVGEDEDDGLETGRGHCLVSPVPNLYISFGDATRFVLVNLFRSKSIPTKALKI